MWPTVSELWAESCRGSHVVELRVDAYQDGVLVASDLPVDPENSTLTVDGLSPIQRSVELTISDPTLVPTSPSSLLSPHATELVITKGFRFPDGTRETVPVGVFRIARPATALYGAVVITGVDRAKLVQDDTFITTTSSTGGATYLSEMVRLILTALPDTDVYVASDIVNDEPLPATTWEEDTSILDAVAEMALAIDCEVYVDAAGVFQIRRLPTLDAEPVTTIDLGETGVIVDATEEWDREAVYNAVTVRGEFTDGSTPIHWTSRDLNPQSPTYWNGPFGHRPRVYTSPMIRSLAQAIRASGTLLWRSIAPVRTVHASIVPNPALEAGDVVMVHLPATHDRQDVRRERHMIRGYTMPLGLGPMELDLYTPEPIV